MKIQEYKQKKLRRIINTIFMFCALVLGLYGYLLLDKYGYGLSGLLKPSNTKADKYHKYMTETIAYNGDNKKVLGESTEEALSIPVLNYHGIVEKIAGDEDVLYEDFKAQMISLKQNGYQTITLSDLDAFLNGGKKLPKKSFVLTFDDGRKDSYYPVDPILKALNYHAVIFLIDGAIKDNDVFHLTYSEIKDLIKTGRWEIGSHSKDGHVLAQIDEIGNKGHWMANKLWIPSQNKLETDEEYTNRVKQDLVNSKIELENNFGVNISGFAFPFGDYAQNSTNFKEAKEIYLYNTKANYKLAFYQPWGELVDRNYPGVDTFMVRRITVNSNFKSGDLLKELENGLDKSIGYSDNFEANNGWIENWGSMNISDAVMKMNSNNTEYGAAVYLKGSENWDRYMINVDVNVGLTTNTFSILANVDRNNNYSYCNFSKNGVSYNERKNGIIRKGKYWNHSLFYTFSTKFKAGVINDGNTISCLVNDKIVVKDDVRTKVKSGMIGFSIWSEEGKAEAQLDNFKSTSLE